MIEDAQSIKTQFIPSSLEYIKFSYPISISIILELLAVFTAIVLLGSKATEEVAVLAMTNTMLMFGFFYIYDSSELIGLRCTSKYAVKNYREYTINFVRMCLTFTIFMLGGAFLMTLSGIILKACGLDPVLASKVHKATVLGILWKLSEGMSQLLRGALISQKHSDFAIPLTVSSLVIAIIVMFVSIGWMEMGVTGFVLGMMIKSIYEFFFLVFTTLKRSNREIFFLPTLSQTFEGFWSNLKYTATIFAARFGGMMGLEVNLLIAASTNNVNTIACWQFYSNFLVIILVASLGFTSGYRTFAKIILVKANPATLKIFQRRAFKCVVVIFSIIAVVACIFAGAIARIYTFGENALTLKSIVRYNALEYVGGVLFLFFSSSMRVAGFEKIQCFVSVVPYPIVSIASALLFVKCFEWGAFGLAFSLMVADSASAIFLAWYYYNHEDSGLNSVAEHGGDIEEHNFVEEELLTGINTAGLLE